MLKNVVSFTCEPIDKKRVLEIVSTHDHAGDFIISRKALAKQLFVTNTNARAINQAFEKYKDWILHKTLRASEDGNNILIEERIVLESFMSIKPKDNKITFPEVKKEMDKVLELTEEDLAKILKIET